MTLQTDAKRVPTLMSPEMGKTNLWLQIKNLDHSLTTEDIASVNYSKRPQVLNYKNLKKIIIKPKNLEKMFIK